MPAKPLRCQGRQYLHIVLSGSRHLAQSMHAAYAALQAAAMMPNSISRCGVLAKLCGSKQFGTA